MKFHSATRTFRKVARDQQGPLIADHLQRA
jgi:hypothetical protein